MSVHWEITQEMKVLPKLHKPVFIEGLPGIGNVGKIAVDFLIEELKAKKIFSFFCHRFPHSVFVTDNNVVEMPKLELYVQSFGGKKPDLLLLTGDIQPIDEESCYAFCEEIIILAKKLGCQEIITTGGIGLQQMPEHPRVFITANQAELLKKYGKLPVEKKIYGVVGPIVGVSGVLLGLGKKRDMPGIAFLAETFGHPLYLGMKGAKELLRVFEQQFGYGIDLKKMSKDIGEVEQQLIKRTKELTAGRTQQAGAKAKPQEVRYIG